MARNPQPSADPVLLDTSSNSDSPPPPQIITRRQARYAPIPPETSFPRSVPPRSPDLSREVSTNIRELTSKLNEDNEDSDPDYEMSEEDSSDSTDYEMSEEDSSDSTDESSTKLPQSPVETAAQFMGLDLRPPRAPTNQSDDSDTSFWQKMRDNLLAEASELRKQGNEMHKQGYILYDRGDKLCDMAKECKGDFQNVGDDLLEEAAELTKQGDELHKKGYVLYDRADKLCDIAKECEGEESDYPSESW